MMYYTDIKEETVVNQLKIDMAALLKEAGSNAEPFETMYVHVCEQLGLDIKSPKLEVSNFVVGPKLAHQLDVYVTQWAKKELRRQNKPSDARSVEKALAWHNLDRSPVYSNSDWIEDDVVYIRTLKK